MSLNSSSSSSSYNASLPPPHQFSSLSLYSALYICFTSTTGTLNVTAFTIASLLLLLPLYVFVLYLGLRRRRQQRSDAPTRHSDVFTYHMVVIELMSVSGSTFVCCGAHTRFPQMVAAGIYLFVINLTGQMLFHLLTCVERYLAVVHPVTYLSLRRANGIRIRNVTISFAWLLCFTTTGVLSVAGQLTPIIITTVFIALAFGGVSFCSLSVLCVLIRPGPGEGGGGRQSKLRALYTITAIMGVLLFRLAGSIMTTALFSQLLETGECGLWLSIVWFCLPSSFVLPLLFLQRAEKLLCCKKN